jgi:hypothetical protein
VKTQITCVNADGSALSIGDMPRITISGLASYLSAVTFDDSTAAPFDVGARVVLNDNLAVSFAIYPLGMSIRAILNTQLNGEWTLGDSVSIYLDGSRGLNDDVLTYSSHDNNGIWSPVNIDPVLQDGSFFQISISKSPIILQRSSGWEHFDENFVITPNKNIAGQTEHTIKLKMRNKPTSQDPLTLTIGINTFTNSPVTITNGNVNEYKPGYIVAPTVNGGAGVTEVYQSTDNPCATNTITVSIVTNVPVCSSISLSLYINTL